MSLITDTASLLFLCTTHVSGGIHDELPLDGAHAVLLVLRVQLVAGDHERVHVGDGAAGGQDAVARLEADDLAHARQTLVLHQDEDRRDLVGEHVCVGRRRQPLARQRHDVQPRGELVEEIGVS